MDCIYAARVRWNKETCLSYFSHAINGISIKPMIDDSLYAGHRTPTSFLSIPSHCWKISHLAATDFNLNFVRAFFNFDLLDCSWRFGAKRKDSPGFYLPGSCTVQLAISPCYHYWSYATELGRGHSWSQVSSCLVEVGVRSESFFGWKVCFVFFF